MVGHRRLTTLIGVACAAALTLPGTTAQATGFHNGAGFNSLDDGLLSSYTIFLVDSTDIEEFRAEAESVAAELTTITGIPVTVASGVVASRPSGQGEILIETAETSFCDVTHGTAGLAWLGCTQGSTAYSGGPRTDVEYVQGGTVDLNIDLVGLPADLQRHVVAHEVGHALGLKHYDVMFEGHYQIMKSATDAIGEETHYQSGDINGLLYERDRGAP